MRALVAFIAASLAVTAGEAGAIETGNRQMSRTESVRAESEGDKPPAVLTTRFGALMTLRGPASWVLRAPMEDPREQHREGADQRVAAPGVPHQETMNGEGAAGVLGDPGEGPGQSIYANPNHRRDPMLNDGVIIAPLPSGVLVGLGGLAGVAVWLGVRRRSCAS